MKSIQEYIAEIKLKYSVVAVISGFGCSAIPIFGLIIVFGSFLLLPLLFDFSASATGYGDIQDGVDERIQVVQTDFNLVSGQENLEIDGSLIAATLSVTLSNNSNISMNVFNDNYNEENFKNGTDSSFPTYSMLNEMANGMVGDRYKMKCALDADPTKITYQTYVQQLKVLDDYTDDECPSGYSETHAKDVDKNGDETGESYPHYLGKFIVSEVYEKVYLPKTYFSRDDTFKLDAVEDATLIKSYIGDIYQTYYDYLAVVYNYESDMGGYLNENGVLIYSSDGTMVMPLKGSNCITSDFGGRILKGGWDYHRGIDLRAQTNLNLYSMVSGKIYKVKKVADNSCGRYVMIEFVDSNTNHTMYLQYCHMSSVASGISINTPVIAGATILGQTGGSGTSNTTYDKHLHLSIFDKSMDKANCPQPQQGQCVGNERNSDCTNWTSYGCAINPLLTLQQIDSSFTWCPGSES